MNSTKKIEGMFSGITKVYDGLNDIMSFGLSRIWRMYASKAVLSGKKEGFTVLDLAIGTGYMTGRILRDSKNSVNVVGCDITRAMLLSASRNLGDGVPLVLADGRSLPFRNGSFNAVVSAFSLRSFIEEGAAEILSEIKRALVQEGMAVFVDTGRPQGNFMNAFFHVYMNVIKLLGGIYDRKSYYWLAKSIWTLDPNEFKKAMIKAGYSSKAYVLPFGVPYLFVGKKK
ncbi:MAG: class I SAM-dependent methyltransferase [Nitrososphaerota archaeon]|jgi:demethylmenaquinone methyltransferase/2-methoxy-6-polyprenyl-1,4-benzoquinol methylase|nr:class I SAM-dependent methyltransferase [Nitrososphaerota archaeon]MDG6926902.1 class I SAM-dependent methyltransferase [Nitrososphaerota archaeon]MDG6929980.1 class I SAM-dependent methyltransferase [Nitrososphaerota archaeon]MDG6931931.1 class I SAM-dependent methyltransferase [Nitrososphaerota archaeon]MDG6943866.1 class I SAM-dependent methyltransferase [Nitrososphaerota archaeon]